MCWYKEDWFSLFLSLPFLVTYNNGVFFIFNRCCHTKLRNDQGFFLIFKILTERLESTTLMRVLERMDGDDCSKANHIGYLVSKRA